MPDDVKSVSRYEQDFNAWALAQAESIELRAKDATRLAVRSLIEHGELPEAAMVQPGPAYTQAQVLEDWWPDSPSSQTSRRTCRPGRR
jgi:hypothetical protein